MKKIADIYMENSRLDKAGEWFRKATMTVQDAEPHTVKAKIYETQGHYFLKTKQFLEALDSFHKAKDTFDKTGYPLGYDNISPMIQKLKRRQKSKLNWYFGYCPILESIMIDVLSGQVFAEKAGLNLFYYPLLYQN